MGEERMNGRKKKERAYVLLRAVWILRNAMASLPPRSVVAARRRERWAGRSTAGGTGPLAGVEMQLCNEGESCGEGKRGALQEEDRCGMVTSLGRRRRSSRRA
jgi:hypothetical protein